MFNQQRVVLLVGAKGPYRCIYGTAGRFKATVTDQPNPWTGREDRGLWMVDEALRQSSTGAQEGGKTTLRALGRGSALIYMNEPKRRRQTLKTCMQGSVFFPIFIEAVFHRSQKKPTPTVVFIPMHNQVIIYFCHPSTVSSVMGGGVPKLSEVNGGEEGRSNTLN